MLAGGILLAAEETIPLIVDEIMSMGLIDSLGVDLGEEAAISHGEFLESIQTMEKDMLDPNLHNVNPEEYKNLKTLFSEYKTLDKTKPLPKEFINKLNNIQDKAYFGGEIARNRELMNLGKSYGTIAKENRGKIAAALGLGAAGLGVGLEEGLKLPSNNKIPSKGFVTLKNNYRPLEEIQKIAIKREYLEKNHPQYKRSFNFNDPYRGLTTIRHKNIDKRITKPNVVGNRKNVKISHNTNPSFGSSGFVYLPK